MKNNAFLIVSAILLSLFLTGFASAEALTPQLYKAKAAAEMLKAQGDAAISKIKDPESEFPCAGGKGYVWIHNPDGVMVMHPVKPALDG